MNDDSREPGAGNDEAGALVFTILDFLMRRLTTHGVGPIEAGNLIINTLICYMVVHEITVPKNALPLARVMDIVDQDVYDAVDVAKLDVGLTRRQ